MANQVERVHGTGKPDRVLEDRKKTALSFVRVKKQDR